MNSRPPRLATWVLQRFLTGRSIEPILGDLAEEYNTGRSGLWYWRQVFTAIFVGSYSQIRSHYVLAARAIAIGWVVRWLVEYAWHNLIPIPKWLAPLIWFNPQSYLGTILIWQLVRGSVISVVAAWIVGRLHRPYSLPMVFVYQSWFVLWTIPDLSRLLLDAPEHSRYIPYLILLIAQILIWTAGAITGGLLSAPAPSDPAPAQLRVSA